MESLPDIPISVHKTLLNYETNVQGLRPIESEYDLEKKAAEGEIEVKPNTPSSENLDEFPDGGLKAWAVVFGAFWVWFSTEGYITSWGVFQVYYQQVILRHSSPSEIAWIGSIQRSIFFAPGVIVGRLFDLGYFRIPFATGSVLIIVGTFLIPVCKVYWHFLLCQGFMIGVGCGLIFGTAGTVITHWWKKKRGLAFGVASCGGSLGGVFFPIILRQVLPKVGFTWTLRIMGFILIFTLGMANLCLTRRLPPQKAHGGLFGLHVFRNAPFSVYCLSSLITPLGTFIIGAFITSSAISSGISSNFSFYLVAMHNGASLFGAVAFGFLGDRLGAMNVLILTFITIGAITMVWPFCSTVASLSVISILYGFTIGASSALSQVPVAAMGGTDDLGRRMGTVNTVRSIGSLCGAPLGGLLISTSLGYKAVGYYAGMIMLFSQESLCSMFFSGGMAFLGATLFALARFLKVPRLWAKF